eukprot:gene5646-5605_t
MQSNVEACKVLWQLWDMKLFLISLAFLSDAAGTLMSTAAMFASDVLE